MELTQSEIDLGYRINTAGQKVYNPIEKVNRDTQARSDAQKAESLVLTTENVKRLQAQVAIQGEAIKKVHAALLELHGKADRVTAVEAELVKLRERLDRANKVAK